VVHRTAEGKHVPRILYISYDGLADPLGRSQILPYLSRLSEREHRITILSCEKPYRMDTDEKEIRKLCDRAGIAWHPLSYHKNPPILSSIFDAAALRRAAFKLHRKDVFDVVHCRSYIPASVGLALKRRFGTKLLFDMRGFWPEEKIEAGVWNLRNPAHLAVYRYFKRLESRLLQGADHIISLTDAGKQQLLTRRELAGGASRISVIRCCVEFDHFRFVTTKSRAEAKRALGLPVEDSVLAYLGSLGGNYRLGEMLQFFRAYHSRKANAHFLIVTHDEAEPIRREAAEHGILPSKLIISRASREEVPLLMAAADVGVAFKHASFSAKGCCPTKMGEMLALGLPIVANAGVGDMETMIDQMGCGVAISEFGSDSYELALDALELLRSTARERRERALSWFDIEIGVNHYERIYLGLSSEKAAEGTVPRGADNLLDLSDG